MTEVFRAKLRRIGNSLGLIIPVEIIRKLGFQKDDVVDVAIPPRKEVKNRIIMEIAGIDAGKSEFKREKGDRY
jgi:antitoxin component of MazEF toxin-antitoxin module